MRGAADESRPAHAGAGPSPSAGRLRAERRGNPADTAPEGNSFARLTSDSVEILSETGF